MIARWGRLFALGGVLGIVLPTAALARPARAADQNVSLVDFAFNPADISIAVGDRVIWTNASESQHTVTSDATAFDSGGIVARQSYVVTFQRPGDFAYHCRVHPQQMRGVVHVGGPSPTPTTAPSTPTTRPVTPPPPGGTVLPPPPPGPTTTSTFLVPTTSSSSTSSTLFAEANPPLASGGSNGNNDDTKRRVAGGVAGALVAAGVVALVLVRRAEGV